MSIATFTHALGASLDYQITWTAALEDPILSETFEVVLGHSDLTVEAGTPDGADRICTISGGSAGSYKIRHTVTFTSGEIDSRTFVVNIQER